MSDIFTSPHIAAGPYSPLETLALRALRRYGEMSPSTIAADVLLGFIDYGNEVVDDVLIHPYFVGPALSYYSDLTQQRAIPDHVVLSGLLFRYARDKRSEATPRYEADYLKTLNSVMYRVKFGNSPSWELQAVDYPHSNATGGSS